MQVFDIPPAALTVTEYQMMRRTCGCGQVTTAAPPPGVTGGPVCYGPGVVDAATLLASTDVIGVERAADLMGALLQAPVSTDFVSGCLVRLDAALTAAAFEDALKDALRASDVPGTDETPAPLTTVAVSEQDCGNPHVYTVRTMRAYTGGGPDLIWYGAAGDRTKAPVTGFGILDGYRGVLVRDDYGGYLSYDDTLAGVQQCLAHLYRYLDDAYAIDPVSQVWTRQAGDALREAAAAVRTGRAGNCASLDPALLARLRHSYDQDASSAGTPARRTGTTALAGSGPGPAITPGSHPHRPHRRGPSCGVQPGRAAARHRRRRRDGAAVGLTRPAGVENRALPRHRQAARGRTTPRRSRCRETMSGKLCRLTSLASPFTLQSGA